MAITNDERRFLRYWQEQRRDGKSRFLVTYCIGLFIMLFMAGVAIGLFSGLPFIKVGILLGWVVGAAVLAFFISNWLWRRQEARFQAIIRREVPPDL